VTLPALTPGLLIGLEIVVFAVVLWLLKPTLVRRAPSAGRVVNWASVVALLVGVALAGINVLTEQTPETSRVNPVKRTVDSIAAGAGLYQASCAACHGVDAHGGGPLSGTTQIRPPSLVSGHLNQHTDGDIFFWISNGLPGGMPAWASKLSETDRWNLVNYLRSLNGQGPVP
jgi:mono/diheme cytochrome c family protein